MDRWNATLRDRSILFSFQQRVSGVCAALLVCTQTSQGEKAVWHSHPFPSIRIHSHPFPSIRIHSHPFPSIPIHSEQFSVCLFPGQGLKIRHKGPRLTFNGKEEKKTTLTLLAIRVVQNQLFPPWLKVSICIVQKYGG